MTYIDPFAHLAAIHWSHKAWCLGEGGEYIGVEPEDGDQTNIGLTMSTFTSGLAIAGKHVYTLFFGGPPQKIIEHDIEAGTQTEFTSTTADIGFDDADDVATCGRYLYCSGADTGDGSSTYRVSKWDLATGVRLWSKNLGAYTGGAIGIAANPGGFMITSASTVPGLAKFYDADGNYLGQDNTIADAISYEWAVCATRDRFFLAQKTDLTASGQPQLRCYDNNGAIQWTINAPADPVVELGERFYPAATERHVFFWCQTNPGPTNARVVVCDRTVTRDGNGNITGDTVDTANPTTYDLGVVINNLRKGSVDSSTFRSY